MRLSPHPAFRSQPRYSRRADQTRCLWVSGTHQETALRGPRHLLFPVRSVNSCLEVTAGTPFAIRSVTSSLLPGGPSPGLPHDRIALGYYAASVLLSARWHSRVCWPDWLSGADTTAEEFPHSASTDDRTRSGLLHAGWIGDNTSGVRKPDALPHTVLVPVIQPLAPVLDNGAPTQVSRVRRGSGFDT